jgi:DNA-binding response OmpR family regulator
MATKKILIVDDDPDYVAATTMVLESAGYKVESIGEIAKASDAIKKGRPDLIILDVMFVRDTDGFHLARELKSDSKIASIPILMMTSIGKKRDFTFEAAKDKDYVPVEDFLEKPVPPDVLKARVKALLGG